MSAVSAGNLTIRVAFGLDSIQSTVDGVIRMDEIKTFDVDESWEGLPQLQIAKTVRTMMKLNKVDVLRVKLDGRVFEYTREKIEARIEALTPAPKADSEDVGF